MRTSIAVLAVLAIVLVMPGLWPALGADQPAPSPAASTAPATAPAGHAIAGKAAEGFAVELVGIRYDGEVNLATGQTVFQPVLCIRVTAPTGANPGAGDRGTGLRPGDWSTTAPKGGATPAATPGGVLSMKFAVWGLTQAVDEAGKDLRGRIKPVPEGEALRVPLSNAMRAPWMPSITANYSLGELDGPPARLEKVRGKVVMLVPEQRVTKDLSLPNPGANPGAGAGAEQELAPGMTGQIDKLDKSAPRQVKIGFSYHLKLGAGPAAAPYAPSLLESIDILDEQGQKMTPTTHWVDTARWQKVEDGWKVTGTIGVPTGAGVAAPKTLRLSIFTGIKDKTLEFEFERIPLGELLHASAPAPAPGFAPAP